MLTFRSLAQDQRLSDEDARGLGMSIRVWVLNTRRVPDPTSTGMGMIFYPWVAPVPDPNRDDTGRVFFPTRG
jgi:hypothetical protein